MIRPVVGSVMPTINRARRKAPRRAEIAHGWAEAWAIVRDYFGIAGADPGATENRSATARRGVAA